MNLRDKRVLLTGATGGIGAELAAALLDAEARVLLSGRDHAALNRVANELDPSGTRTAIFAADLAKECDRAALCAYAVQWQGGIDVVVNNAGVGEFTLLNSQTLASMQSALLINLLAPMDLCRQLLPYLSRRDDAHIVNIGSVFGSIGFAANTVYCATKFGLRGFSEALRRELADSRVRVHYFAPRATHTRFNSMLVDDLNEALGNSTDEPREVARMIVSALRADRLEVVLGWPEKFFARVNALLPRVVDGALGKKLRTIQQFARRSVTSTPAYAGHSKVRRVG